MKILLASGQTLAVPQDWRAEPAFSLDIVQAEARALGAMVVTQAADLLVLDYGSELLLDLVRDINSACPHLVIIAIVPEPTAGLLLELLRAGVVDVLASTNELSVARVRAIQARLGGAGEAGTRRACQLQAFVSAKGGAGATTVLANYAHAIRLATERSILAIDVSLPWGDLDLSLAPNFDGNDLAAFLEEIDRIDNPLFRAMVTRCEGNIDFIPAPMDPANVPLMKAEDLVKLINIAKSMYDYILFDFGSSMNYMNLAVLDMVDRLHIIVRADVPGARRTGQMFKLLRDLEFPDGRIAIVLNAVEARKGLPAESFEAAIGQSAIVRLPHAPAESEESSTRSLPIVRAAPGSAYARAVADWVGRVEALPRKDNRKWSVFASIFRK